jgi:hypothetical protein
MSLKEGHELVTTGPYRLVRHPIYAGILTAVLGSTLVAGGFWLVLFLVAAPFFVYSQGIGHLRQSCFWMIRSQAVQAVTRQMESAHMSFSCSQGTSQGIVASSIVLPFWGYAQEIADASRSRSPISQMPYEGLNF